MAGDLDLLRALVQIYTDTTPAQVAELRQAIKQRDSAAIRRLAHTLKGAVGNFGQGPAWQAALQLEMMGREGKFEGIDLAADNLERSMEQVRLALQDLVAAPGSAFD